MTHAQFAERIRDVPRSFIREILKDALQPGAISFANSLPDQCVLLGTFSKTIVPGFRLGWIVAPDHLMDKLIAAKQAADLHTAQMLQCIVYQYLRHNSLDGHINKIINVYGKQKDAMVAAMEHYFPQEINFTCVQASSIDQGIRRLGALL